MADDESKKLPERKTQTLIFIQGTAGAGDAVVDKTETESLGDTDFGEATVIQLKHADGCGHVIHTASEVGGISICGKVLCTKCAQNLCYRCGKPVCGEHIRRVKKDDEERIYCWQCRPWVFIEEWHGSARWLLGGLLILFLLKLLRGC